MGVHLNYDLKVSYKCVSATIKTGYDGYRRVRIAGDIEVESKVILVDLKGVTNSDQAYARMRGCDARPLLVEELKALREEMAINPPFSGPIMAGTKIVVIGVREMADKEPRAVCFVVGPGWENHPGHWGGYIWDDNCVFAFARTPVLLETEE